MGLVAFQDWLGELQQALEAGDAATLSHLFSEDAVFHDAPFIAPIDGRDAIRASFAEELAERRDVTFTFEVIRFEGQIGWAMWSNSFTRAGTEDPVRMEGILKAEFNTDGLCSEFRQWWHMMEPGQGDLMRDMDA